MKILMASSEMSSLARTGGLGDVLDALPVALREAGHEVSVVLPLYRSIRENPQLRLQETGVQFSVQVGEKSVEAGVVQTVAPNGTQVFLVRRDEYFDRSALYGIEGKDYEDNAERFIFFSKAVLELARRMQPVPDVIHVHDWQTALIPVLVKEWALPFRTVLTIHNLAFQGNFWPYDFRFTNLPGSYFGAQGVEFFGNLNLLKAGILFADAITTVSEPYLHEIQTPESGCGLDAVIREHRAKFIGILNGADYSVWNPETDKFLPANFSAEDLSGKRICRDTLLSQLGLDPQPRGPVIGMVTRLSEQKGFDILLPLLDRLLSDDVRLVVLGEGDPAYEAELRYHTLKHRGRFAFRQEFDAALSHLIEAGSDITLIPSRFEPCGLTAIYSLKYGALPVARSVGGLTQIIRDHDPMTDDGWGYLFEDYTAESCWDAIKRARLQFIDQPVWGALMERAMQQDFSWKQAAEEYSTLYRRLVPISVAAVEPEPAAVI
ncbi:MAG TPA: glycogen synthase GlgA [Chthoniobacterales bacterium]|jgi:starch synthase